MALSLLLVNLHLLIDTLFLLLNWSPLSERLHIVLLKASNLLGHIERDDILVDGAAAAAVQAEKGGEVQVGGKGPGPALVGSYLVGPALVGGGGGAVVGQADHVRGQPGSGGLQQGGQ